MGFEFFNVGQSRSEWRGLKDGYIMEYNNISGLILYMFFKHPLPEEEAQIAADKLFKITFTDYKGVGFFGVKFGNLPWGDCAFSPNLYKDTPAFEELKNGKGYALNIVFIDTETGTLKALRQIGLGNNFSRLFRDWCLESLKRQMSKNWYDKTVDECYEEYDVKQLIKQAKFQYEINPHREEKERE